MQGMYYSMQVRFTAWEAILGSMNSPKMLHNVMYSVMHIVMHSVTHNVMHNLMHSVESLEGQPHIPDSETQRIHQYA